MEFKVVPHFAYGMFAITVLLYVKWWLVGL